MVLVHKKKFWKILETIVTSPQLCSSSTWWTLAIFFHQSGIKEILDFVYHLKSEQLEFQNFRAPCNLSSSTPLDHWAVTGSFVVTWESSRHFAKPPLVFPQNDNWEMSGHSIQMMCYYANMGRASDWLKEISQGPQPFKSTTQIWVRNFCAICPNIIPQGNKR